jgi:hypothetical protein
MKTIPCFICYRPKDESIIVDVESNSPIKEPIRPMIEKPTSIPAFMGMHSRSESPQAPLFPQGIKRRAESPPPAPPPKLPTLVKQESASGEDSNSFKLKIKVFFNQLLHSNTCLIFLNLYTKLLYLI